MSLHVNYWQHLEESQVYHIYNHGVGRENIFITSENYNYFLSKWKMHLPYLDVFAYCLMPNHFHFLVRVKPIENELIKHIENQATSKSELFLQGAISYNTYLEDQFKRLFSGYALAMNKQEKRTGALFHKRFKRVAVTSEEKCLYLLVYIHHNPIHHKFCSEYEDWPHSSYNAYLGFETLIDVSRHEVESWYPVDWEQSPLMFQKYHNDFKYDMKMEMEMLE